MDGSGDKRELLWIGHRTMIEGKGPIWEWAGSPRTHEDKRFDAKRRETQKKVHKLGNGINMCKRNGGICLIVEV